jgi:hypothetical protein
MRFTGQAQAKDFYRVGPCDYKRHAAGAAPELLRIPPEYVQSGQILANHPGYACIRAVPACFSWTGDALRTPQWLRERRVREVYALGGRKKLPVFRLRHAACSRFGAACPLFVTHSG